MKKVLLCLLGILLVLVEMSITNYIDIFNVSFNLLTIYITIISLYLDETDASIIGAIIGLVKDIVVGGIFGVFIASLFDSMVNIVAVIPVYNTYGILNLVTKGILTIPLINSTLSVLLYNLFKTSILKLKED